jgi:stage V sporulation protein SpoVS
MPMQCRLASCVCVALTLAAGRSAEAQFFVEQPLPPAERYHLEFGLGFWSPEPELTIRFDGPAGTGSDIDFVEDFGIAKERLRDIRGTLKPGRKHKIRFEHVPFEYTAEAVIQRTFVFGGQQFTVGAPAATSVTWDLWKFGYEWDFYAGPAGFAGFVADVKYNKVSAEISAIGLGSELAQANAPVPGFGGIARGYVSKNVSLTGEFTFFKVPDSISEEVDGTFYDFDIYTTVNAGRYVGFQGGYRSIVADYLASEDAGALKMKGIYFGAVVRF